jgi:hypothetical protein
MRSRFVSAVSAVALLLAVATTAQACPPGGYVVRSGGSYYVWYPPPSSSYAPVSYAYVYTPSGEVTRAYYYSPGQAEAGGTVSQTAYYFAPAQRSLRRRPKSLPRLEYCRLARWGTRTFQ